MAHRHVRPIVALLSLALTATFVHAQSSPETRDPAGLRRLQNQVGGAAVVSIHKSTRGARFIRLQPGAVRGLGRGPAATDNDKRQRSLEFFRDYSALLGVSNGSSMEFQSSVADALGETHLTWKQFYRGVPVYGATMKTHFGKDQQLRAVTGTAVPDISVSANPSVVRSRAERAALDFESPNHAGAQLRAGTAKLYVYRQGLAQGVPGENLLAWEIEVTDGGGVRQLVYVDAHTGKVIDSVSGIQDELDRRAFDGHDLPRPPDNYPNGAYWLEGQSFPTASLEANNMITASKETYDFFKNTFGRDSFNGTGGTMDAIFDRGYDCPNASWNGIFISFCPGLTTDDITAHEWGHAYTQYTHDLIYQWQPGALNEAYSDIWGEVVDQINGRGADLPDAARGANSCSTFSPPVARVQVNSPATIAGTKLAQAAQFGNPLTPTGITADVVAALDAANADGPSTLDACTAITNAAQVSGKIAIVNRGACNFSVKVFNAQNAGAVAVIVANNVAAGLPGMGAGINAELVTIPSVGILQSDGTAIRSALASGTVNTTLLAQPGTDHTFRWLMGEDADSDGTGAIRDMFNPNCYSSPAKVTDVAYYVCDAGDGGGVHTNSGIPNHAFALLVDGGSFNGQTIAPIGIAKAAHIYYRAQSVYQVLDSDFADHADALQTSCSDLAASDPLPGLTSGAAPVQITAADCAEVEKAIAAVELRTPPPCNFLPLLNPGIPAACSVNTTTGTKTNIFAADFEAGAQGFTGAGSSAIHQFSRVTSLPSGRAGAGFFAPNTNVTCNDPATNDTSLATLTSPPVVLPAGTDFARATFEHWVATEPGWDGGNLKVSVNGGPFQLIPPSSYSFNGHNVLLFSAAQGNTNPLAGQPSWSGNNAGTVNGGTWGRTLVNLAGFARAGDTVRLRWDFGTDICSGRTGWYVDNVDVYSCVPKMPLLTVNDPQLQEGDEGTRVITFIVSLNSATLRAVSVNYSIADGTAQHGEDFLPVADGTAVIPAGATSTTIGIVLKGDAHFEPNEDFFVNLSGAVNATISDNQGKATIVNDDVATTATPPEE
jgi:Zn-dependent metalloprotease